MIDWALLSEATSSTRVHTKTQNSLQKSTMTRPCCRASVAFVLKFFNLFQLFVGISIILYSVYMLNQWNKHLPNPTLPNPILPHTAPSSDSSDSVSTIFSTARVSNQGIYMNFAADMFSGVHGGINVNASFNPSPWFIYACMGVGVTLCCIYCIGHIAAAAINGCCLCFYALLETVLLLLEVAFILFIAFDRHWEKDLPSDPSGEIGRIREFVEGNTDFCIWIVITVVVIQTLCLLLAIVLRAMVTSQMKDDDSDIEEDSDVRGKAWEPLLNPRPTQTSVSVSVNGKAFHSDIWSSRMREKYGLK